MPQMNPMWWFSLFIVFSLVLILSNSLNYFYFNPSISQASSLKSTKKSFNWKW
uniref:ATP synthase complex subunit 8 n=1 Tax=Amphigerontia montivaga TaxID=2051644 RepID=A0A343QCD8_9NEOP|nr:ATP synthase F0 subunit 8 [Amphigerontia montivaga]ATU07085.1 ATP synthase F0 subunit 8 [Amphigerontia montivaga]